MATCDKCGQQLPEPVTVVTVKAKTERPFVRRVYDLTTRYHVQTGKKVRIQPLLDAFFATTMKDVDPDDEESFERALKAELNRQTPGWDNEG